ncbi:MAG: hypothetical protein IIC95_02335 [Chloroflexi bacterium]|nr:hypothetical protein [Chloroflexota bacterium]
MASADLIFAAPADEGWYGVDAESMPVTFFGGHTVTSMFWRVSANAAPAPELQDDPDVLERVGGGLVTAAVIIGGIYLISRSNKARA